MSPRAGTRTIATPAEGEMHGQRCHATCLRHGRPWRGIGRRAVVLVLRLPPQCPSDRPNSASPRQAPIVEQPQSRAQWVAQLWLGAPRAILSHSSATHSSDDAQEAATSEDLLGHRLVRSSTVPHRVLTPAPEGLPRNHL